MSYRLTHFDSVQRLEDGAFIPFCDGNMDYRAYLAWVAEGNTPEPAIEIDTTPITLD